MYVKWNYQSSPSVFRLLKLPNGVGYEYGWQQQDDVLEICTSKYLDYVKTKSQKEV